MGVEKFLVCGLGSLGQHCVAALQEFGVSVIAIESRPDQNWEIPNLPELVSDLIVGDCRDEYILKQAHIEQCRTAIIVTSDEQVNAETALAVRQLNPHARLVVRSAKENLNQLLGQYLSNFIAFEPTQLSASAFALAALGTETLGLFELDGEPLRVVQHRVQPHETWYYARPLYDFNSHRQHLLGYSHQSTPSAP